ncbi:MAG TPA: hypothetical protein VLL25_07385 [Acidimicrobiales bacterium]|nr:hypothetical protein [Acidimicrobiales bacterium]
MSGRPAGRPSPRRGTSWVLIGLLAVLTAVLVIVFVLRLARSPNAKVNLGTQEFPVGKGVTLAKSIAQGGPLPFQALRGQLDIFVQHLGSDPAHGWFAFETHPPGEPRRCQLTWQPATADFADPCSPKRYPANGDGLNHYPVRVDANGTVIVNLRQSTGTSAPTQ